MAAGTARALARERAAWIRERAKADASRLRELLRAAKQRRALALAATRRTCAKARQAARERVREFRRQERLRINREVAVLRNQARAQCQARRYRIERGAAKLVDKRRAEIREQARLQAQLDRAGRHALRAKKVSSARERAQEDDDFVRSNIPPELLPVFERVKRIIRGSSRKTRTEAFLEWAEAHPEDVLELQGHETDREVRRLVAEHEAAGRELRKTGQRRRKRAAGDVEGVPF